MIETFGKMGKLTNKQYTRCYDVKNKRCNKLLEQLTGHFRPQTGLTKAKNNNSMEDTTETTIKNESLDDGCKIMNSFKCYAQELDAKWDKFERLVKLSRDVTIESKRIIFLLHTVDREGKRCSVLNEAGKRLDLLVKNQLHSIAKELESEDPYLYHRAFSPGIQEFIEAFTYYNYLQNNRLYDWNHYQEKLEYILNTGDISSSEANKENTRQIKTTLTQTDFILGLADLTGELMRKCINNLGIGKTESCFDACSLVRNFYCGFLMVDIHKQKEMPRKMYTLKRSLLQMEMACYNICLRGSEHTKLMLDSVDPSKIYVHEET